MTASDGCHEAGGEYIPVGEILGDGAPWIWHMVDAPCPRVRQTLDDYHRSMRFCAFAYRLYPNNPAGAKARVDQQMGALLMDRVGESQRALKRRRPGKEVVYAALTRLIGDVAHNRTRLTYQASWPVGLAVESGAVEGACTHVMQSRFKCAGMRWKQR